VERPQEAHDRRFGGRPCGGIESWTDAVWPRGALSGDMARAALVVSSSENRHFALSKLIEHVNRRIDLAKKKAYTVPVHQQYTG